MPQTGPSTIVVVLDARVDRADIPALRDRVRTALERSDAALIVCDVGAVINPDAVAVDALARIQLTARRLGCQMRVRSASDELCSLLSLMGLSDVVTLSVSSGLEVRGQPEEREVGRGVEEEDDPADPTA